MYWVLGTGKLISNSGFFPCLLLSAERQAHGPNPTHIIWKAQILSKTVTSVWRWIEFTKNVLQQH
jgi:hypothetical protein